MAVHAGRLILSAGAGLMLAQQALAGEGAACEQLSAAQLDQQFTTFN